MEFMNSSVEYHIRITLGLKHTQYSLQELWIQADWCRLIKAAGGVDTNLQNYPLPGMQTGDTPAPPLLPDV